MTQRPCTKMITPGNRMIAARWLCTSLAICIDTNSHHLPANAKSLTRTLLLYTAAAAPQQRFGSTHAHTNRNRTAAIRGRSATTRAQLTHTQHEYFPHAYTHIVICSRSAPHTHTRPELTIHARICAHTSAQHKTDACRAHTQTHARHDAHRTANATHTIHTTV